MYLELICNDKRGLRYVDTLGLEIVLNIIVVVGSFKGVRGRVK